MATIEINAPQELKYANLSPRGRVFSSPAKWRDQILYFLLPDRFSDGQEYGRPLYDINECWKYKVSDETKDIWLSAGNNFCGGTIKGIESKLDYLEKLGITTIWLGPIFKQHPSLQTYHGYGIQNFLEVEPRFGTRQDLRDLIDAAHNRGIYVILDIIYNHTGNNWFYNINGSPWDDVNYRFSPPYELHGWRSVFGHSIPEIRSLNDGVWPREFQNPNWYTRSGKIGRWDPYDWEDPLSANNEFRRGDFFSLKDLDLNRDDVLSAIITVYKYWIALSDCDGFRIDTVKHVPIEASRKFCNAIREYAEAIGKENFLLLGEVAGGEGMKRNYLEIFGANLDAVLDIGSPSGNLKNFAKGFADPEIFFSQFDGHDILGTHRQIGRYHVSILDDHDMIGRKKERFSAGNNSVNTYHQVAHATGIQLTTLGIPCIYYGTEQAFAGSEDSDPRPSGKRDFEDRYIREAMFGGNFGAFETQECNFFDYRHPAYLRISAIAKVRNRNNLTGLTIRRGRQYHRDITLYDSPWGNYKEEITAWSRVMHDREVLVVLNPNGEYAKGAWINVDKDLTGDYMTYLYRSDWGDYELQNPPTNQGVASEYLKGRKAVRVNLPPGAMAILG